MTSYRLSMSCLVMLLSVITAAAAPSAYRQEVRDVVVKTSGAVSGNEASNYVLSHIAAEKGGFISQKDIAGDQRNLIDSGIFSDVRIYIENLADGVRVVYDVAVAPRVRFPLVIKGNERFSVGKIRDTLGLRDGDRIDRARLDAACDNLREAYRKSYYNEVKIATSISEPDEEGRAVVTLAIDEGPREKLLGFIFEGNRDISSGELRAALGRPSDWNPFKIFYSQWRIDAFDRELVRDRIAATYRSHGYLDVEVSEPVLERETPDSRPSMRIAIKEGARYTIAATSISGISIFPEGELRKVVSSFIKPGEPASDAALSKAEKAIRDYYGSRGYVDTSVDVKLASLAPTGDTSKGGIPSSLRIKVVEGHLADIRSIEIRGNTYTKDKVIRRELAIAPGMIMNEVLAEMSRKRVENLGYFENVRMRHVPSPDDPALHDVVFEVSEKSTGSLMAGIGTSNIDNILGYLDISQNNFDILNWPTFRGGGQKIRFSASIGSSSNSGEISWTDPWFLDRKQSFNVTLYRREYGYSEYDETRIGGDVSLGVPLKYGRFTTKIGAEIVRSDEFLEGTYRLDDGSNDEFSYESMDGRYLRVPLRLSWSYDTRNHPFVPTSGSRNNVFFEIMNSSFGSEYDIYRLGADLRQYVPSFFGHFFSLRLRAESVDCYGDTDEIPINDRYFLGGARSIRGYRYREVGPKAIPSEETGGRAHPVGGQTLAMFTAEYNIPIQKVIRLAAFFDVGNVWESPFDADFSELASTWGFGIRFDIPGFPIRLDYAMPLERDDDYTRTERFVFSIGFE